MRNRGQPSVVIGILIILASLIFPVFFWLASYSFIMGLFFSLLIITVSFLPVFALTGQSFKLFAPLAYTKTYAMAFASVLSVTVVPVLMLWLIRGRIRREMQNPLNWLFVQIYRPIIWIAAYGSIRF